MAFRVGSAPTFSPLADLPSLSHRRIWYPVARIIRIAGSLKSPRGPVSSTPESSRDRGGAPIALCRKRGTSERK